MSSTRTPAILDGRLTPRDAVVHLAVVAALVLAYASPIPYETFLYQPGVSGIGVAYLSLFGHADLAHLLGNVFGFCVLSAASLALLASASRKRFYYVCFALILLVVPPLAALQWELTLAVTEPDSVGTTAGSGFSLITAAFVGLLAVAIGVHQRAALSASLPPVVSSAWALSIAAFLTASSGSASTAVVAVSGVAALAYLGYTGSRLRRAFGEPNSAVPLSLSVIGLCAFVGATIDLFALRPEGVAVRAHVVGLGYGVAVAWLVLGAASLASRRRADAGR